MSAATTTSTVPSTQLASPPSDFTKALVLGLEAAVLVGVAGLLVVIVFDFIMFRTIALTLKMAGQTFVMYGIAGLAGVTLNSYLGITEKLGIDAFVDRILEGTPSAPTAPKA